MSDDSRYHEHAPIRTRPPIVESEPWSTAEIITFFALGLILGIAAGAMGTLSFLPHGATP